MPDDTTTGIPDPDKPGLWLVRPWPSDAPFSGVVRHFLRSHPWGETRTTHLLAYFEGYAAALESAPPDLQTNELHERWRDEMRDCIARCVQVFREKPAEANGNISTLRTATPDSYRVPARQEMVS